MLAPRVRRAYSGSRPAGIALGDATLRCLRAFTTPGRRNWLGLTELALPIGEAYDGRCARWRAWCFQRTCATTRGRDGSSTSRYEAYDEQVVPRMSRSQTRSGSRWPSVGRHRAAAPHRAHRARRQLGRRGRTPRHTDPKLRSREICIDALKGLLRSGSTRFWRAVLNGAPDDRVAGGVDGRRAGGEERLSARGRRGRRGRVARDRRGGDLPAGPLETTPSSHFVADRRAVSQSASRGVVDQVNRIDDATADAPETDTTEPPDDTDDK